MSLLVRGTVPRQSGETALGSTESSLGGLWHNFEKAPGKHRVARRRQEGFVATKSAQPILPALAESTQKDSASAVRSMVS